MITLTEETFGFQPTYSTDSKTSFSARVMGRLALIMYYKYSFAVSGLTTSPPSTPAVTRTNHRLLQAPAPLSLRLPTLGLTSPLELILGAPLAIRQVFVAHMACELPPTSSPPRAYIPYPRSLTALESSLDPRPSLKLL